MDKVPTFLSLYDDTIIRTGKYLSVIQQCYKTARYLTLSLYNIYTTQSATKPE